MIKLTRLDDKKIIVNENFIKIIEEAPDTIITFHDSYKIIVKERMNDIFEIIVKQKNKN